MAVRDEGQHPGTRSEASGGRPSRDLVGYLPVLLVASGLLMYAYLSLCYDRFYGSLGVDPNDVGLSYTGTLARSSGFAVTVIAIPLGFLSGFYVGRREHAGQRERRPGLVPPARPARSFITLASVYLLASLVVYVPLAIPLIRAGDDSATLQTDDIEHARASYGYSGSITPLYKKNLKTSELAQTYPARSLGVITVKGLGASRTENIGGFKMRQRAVSVETEAFLGTLDAALWGDAAASRNLKPGTRWLVEVNQHGLILRAYQVVGSNVVLPDDLAGAVTDDVDGGSSQTVNLAKLKAKAKHTR